MIPQLHLDRVGAQRRVERKLNARQVFRRLGVVRNARLRGHAVEAHRHERVARVLRVRQVLRAVKVRVEQVALALQVGREQIVLEHRLVVVQVVRRHRVALFDDVGGEEQVAPLLDGRRRPRERHPGAVHLAILAPVNMIQRDLVRANDLVARKVALVVYFERELFVLELLLGEAQTVERKHLFPDAVQAVDLDVGLLRAVNGGAHVDHANRLRGAIVVAVKGDGKRRGETSAENQSQWARSCAWKLSVEECSPHIPTASGLSGAHRKHGTARTESASHGLQ